MMKNIFLILIFSANLLYAQKIVKKTVINPDVRSVQINAKNCFEIIMETSGVKEMRVEATIEGEYKNDLILNLKEEGATILVDAGFSPNFKKPNDKLSAHKVVSIALKIMVPYDQNVQVVGAGCNVTASGAYEHLKITLNEGRCTLKGVSEKVTVRTQSGDIHVQSSGAEIRAISKFGKVNANEIPDGNDLYILQSTTGNIDLIYNE